jgi:hypothetical protein
MLSIHRLAHVLVGEPAFTSPEHALAARLRRPLPRRMRQGGATLIEAARSWREG